MGDCEYAHSNPKDFPDTAKETEILTKLQTKRRKRGNDSGKFWSSWSDCSPWGRGTCSWRVYCSPWGHGQCWDNFRPECCVCFLDQTCSQGWEDGGSEITIKRPLVSCGVWSTDDISAAIEGWIQLQFYAGRVWVPEKQGSVCYLTIISHCTPGGQYVAPQSVYKNKMLMKSLQWDYSAREKCRAMIIINGRKVTTINSVVPLASQLQAAPHPPRFPPSGPTRQRGAGVPSDSQQCLLVCCDTDSYLKVGPWADVKGLSEETTVAPVLDLRPQNLTPLGAVAF